MKLLFFCTFVHLIFGQDPPCLPYLSVDISDGAVGSISVKHNVTFDTANSFSTDGSTRGCICNLRSCFRKCCPPNMVMGEEDCEENLDKSLEVTFYNGSEVSSGTKLEHFHVIHGMDCPTESHSMLPFSAEEIRLHTNGSLFIESEKNLFKLEEYCFEVFGNVTSPLVCVLETENGADDETHEIFGYAMILSMPFLLATFLVYLVLPEFHNIHGIALMSYVITLLLAYISLSIAKLVPNIPSFPCHLLGYSILFYFIASFIWMNVMCIDMWLAFRGMSGFSNRKSAMMKRLIIYTVYAWGVPSLNVIIVFLVNTYADEGAKLYPGISDASCFVKKGLPSFLYFYLPMTIFMVINCFMFISTGMKIYKAKKETKVLKHSDSKKHLSHGDKQQFKLYIKLFFAMGINWMAELISFAFGALDEEYPPALSYLTDFINCAYGIVIFFLFVFKWKILRSLKKSLTTMYSSTFSKEHCDNQKRDVHCSVKSKKKSCKSQTLDETTSTNKRNSRNWRYYFFIGKPHLAHELSTSRGTRATNCSTSVSASSSRRMDISMSDLENREGRTCYEPKPN